MSYIVVVIKLRVSVLLVIKISKLFTENDSKIVRDQETSNEVNIADSFSPEIFQLNLGNFSGTVRPI